MFEAHGNVASASLAIDRETRRPRGFGFVEMPDAAEANAAIAALNGAEQGGRKLVVNEARPKEDRPCLSLRIPLVCVSVSCFYNCRRQEEHDCSSGLL